MTVAGLGDIFGKGSIAEQMLVWGVLNQVIQALAQPGFTALANEANSVFPEAPLPVGAAADAAARNITDTGAGADQAAKSGLSPDLFAILVRAAQRAPDLSTVAEAYRRQLIGAGGDDPTGVGVVNALTDMGIRADWHDVIQKLFTQIPTVAEVMNAWLEGQITEDEARTRYLEAGGDPTWFQTSYNANGEAPTPVELLELLNRGIIAQSGTGPAATSYEQGFLEGPWRNKWLGPMIALREYYPPPRTVTAMFHAGQLTHDQAAGYLAKQGLTPDLIAAYLSPKSTAATATEKHLAKADLLALYGDGLMAAVDTEKGLVSLGYTQSDAAALVRLSDYKATSAQLKAGVTRVRTLFEAGKLSSADARGLLVKLGVTAEQAQSVVETWALTASQTVKTLTAAQIESAWYYNILDTDSALALLQQLGYDAFDAYVALSVKNKGPLPGVARPASPYPAPKAGK